MIYLFHVYAGPHNPQWFKYIFVTDTTNLQSVRKVRSPGAMVHIDFVGKNSAVC